MFGFKVSTYFAFALVASFWYAALVIVVGKQMIPGESLFGTLVIFLAATLAGKGVDSMGLGLPPLIGMLLVGFALRNLPVVNVGADISVELSKGVRSAALAIILTRAGLGVNLEAVWRLRGLCVRLALLPASMECLTAALLARGLLHFHWTWCFMLGYLMSAISPAVVVPSILSLQDQGYGKAAGIPSLVVASAALDDVYAISGFGVCFAMVFGSSSPWVRAALAPVELTLGALTGFIAAKVCVLSLPSVSVRSLETPKTPPPLAPPPPPPASTHCTLEMNSHPSQEVWESREDGSLEVALSFPPELIHCSEDHSGPSTPQNNGGVGVGVEGIAGGGGGGGDTNVVVSPFMTPPHSVTPLPPHLPPPPPPPPPHLAQPLRDTAAATKDALAIEEEVPRLRSLLLVGCTLTLIVVSQTLKVGAGGALGTIVAAATAARGWDKEDKAKVSSELAWVWSHAAQPLLFGLIGAAVSGASLTPATVGKGMVILLAGGCVRLCTAALSVWRGPSQGPGCAGASSTSTGLSQWESLFVGLAWIPKATVQAALGAAALDQIKGDPDSTDEKEGWAKQILAITVLAIVISAPLGATAIALSGKRLLSRDL